MVIFQREQIPIVSQAEGRKYFVKNWERKNIDSIILVYVEDYKIALLERPNQNSPQSPVSIKELQKRK